MKVIKCKAQLDESKQACLIKLPKGGEIVVTVAGHLYVFGNPFEKARDEVCKP